MTVRPNVDRLHPQTLARGHVVFRMLLFIAHEEKP